jgi:hypothetical protein
MKIYYSLPEFSGKYEVVVKLWDPKNQKFGIKKELEWDIDTQKWTNEGKEYTETIECWLNSPEQEEDPFEIQYINPGKDTNYRITLKSDDTRIATCYDYDHAYMVCNALNLAYGNSYRGKRASKITGI